MIYLITEQLPWKKDLEDLTPEDTIFQPDLMHCTKIITCSFGFYFAHERLSYELLFNNINRLSKINMFNVFRFDDGPEI